MKRILILLTALILVCSFVFCLVSCTDNTEAENTTEVTESTAEPTPGTVYYPPGQEPVERPHPKG